LRVIVPFASLFLEGVGGGEKVEVSSGTRRPEDEGLEIRCYNKI